MFRTTLLTALICAPAAWVAQPALNAAIPNLTGSWQITLTASTPPIPPLPIPGLATFNADGTMTETDGLELIPTMPTSTGRVAGSPGHGIWQLGPSLTYYYVEYFSLLVNSNGSLFATNQTIITLTPASTGMSFTGTYTTQTTNSAGVVLKTVTGTITGQLIPHPALP